MGRTTRVNAVGTSGANGDIEGNLLVYQQFEGRGSGIKFFDLTTGARSYPPKGRQYETLGILAEHVRPMVALRPPGAAERYETVILFDLTTGERRGLAKVREEGRSLAPGQVSGDWAVWSRCPGDSPCNVTRYRISTDEAELIPNPDGREHHSPSVDARGNVFYVRGHGRCGSRVSLIRQPLEGDETVLWRLPNGDDIGRTHVQMRAHGRMILFDQFSCGRPVESDGWQFCF